MFLTPNFLQLHFSSTPTYLFGKLLDIYILPILENVVLFPLEIKILNDLFKL